MGHPGAQLIQEIFQCQNKARTNPKSLIPYIKSKLQYFKGNTIWEPKKIGLMTQEGPSGYRGAIQFLQRQKPLNPLKLSKQMSRAADDHCRDQGPKGGMGHTGSDGSSMDQRINRYGKWQGSCSENISYGCDTAMSIICQLVIDDGVQSRGHRTNIYNPHSTVCGIGFAEHTGYKFMCTVDFAGGYLEKGNQGQTYQKPKRQPRRQRIQHPQQSHQNQPQKPRRPQHQQNMQQQIIYNGQKMTMQEFKKKQKQDQQRQKKQQQRFKNFNFDDQMQGFGDNFGKQKFGDFGDFGKNFGQKQQKQSGGGDRYCTGTSTNTSTRTVNGRTEKTTTTKKTYSDGSTETNTSTQRY